MIEEPVKYITKVEIQGLWGRYDIEWNLHPDVNVLAGINGSGKTTILNFIYNTVSHTFITEDALKKIENILVTFDTGEFSCKSEKFGAYTLSIKSDIISTFDTELNLYDADTKKRSDRQVKTELDLRLVDLQREYMKYRIRTYKNNSETNRDTHIRFLSMLDELFSETHKKVNSDKEELEFLLGDKEINVYQLSSGEKQLLVILLTALVQDNKPAILLMDEPEISLHLDWQENLINYIRELNPNVQLIIATHSPGLIMKGWGGNVFELSDLTMKDRLAS